MTREDLIDLLKRILSLATAPFHERFVSSFICAELVKAGLDFYLDEHGNIIAGRGEDRSLACIAHMDHPGFEVVEVRGGKAEAEWFGGVDEKYFVGSGVAVYDRRSGEISGRGVIEEAAKSPEGRVEKIVFRVDGGVEPGAFGTWDLVPFRLRGERVYTKGADDLVGCAIVLAVLRELNERGVGRAARGVFTRAEEQGFIGSLGMIQSGTLPLSERIISVEASKALPGALLGSGPVIRLGDRTSMFDPRMALFMDYAAREIRKNDSTFVYQRRVMDGGTCEATPYVLRGYVAGGIAVPLHNYHNQGRGKITPEVVHLRDVEGAVRLLVELVVRMEEFELPVTEAVQRLERRWQKYRAKLAR